MIISLVKTMDKQTKIFSSIKIVIIAMVAANFLAGCTSHKALTLMPTPVLYQKDAWRMRGDAGCVSNLELFNKKSHAVYRKNRACNF
jgi:hypothetical protein